MSELDVDAVIGLLRGDAASQALALDRIVPMLHADLRRIARSQRRRVGGGETLSTTALIHETYLKLRGSHLRVEDRAHFLSLAALAMRQILTDQARARLALRRAPEQQGLESPDLGDGQVAVFLLEMDEALQRLEQLSPRLAHVVQLRFFGGYSEPESAEILGVNERTVRRDWQKARAWLRTAIDAA